MTLSTITQTIQEGSEYHMPWMYSHEPGQRFVVEHKKAGKVVKTETWVLVQFRQSGETMRRWDRVDGEPLNAKES